VGEGATGKVYVGLNINTGAQKKIKKKTIRERCMPEYQHRYACVFYVSCAQKKNEQLAEAHPSLYVN
jgi:hypothetical protein